MSQFWNPTAVWIGGAVLAGCVSLLGCSPARSDSESPVVAIDSSAAAEVRSDTTAPLERVGSLDDAETQRVSSAGGPEISLESCERISWNPQGYPVGDHEYESGRVSFAIQAQDEVIPYRLMSLFLLPGEELRLEAVLAQPDSRFRAEAGLGTPVQTRPDAWIWTAPDRPQVTHIDVCDLTHEETLRLKIFVLQPYAGSTVVDGYRIGKYESLPLRDNPAYGVPEGLVEVTRGMEEEWITPHFQLRQFICKQEAGYPRFLVLRTRLLMKLEMLLERINAAGHDAKTLFVMSGYRTPYYNAAIGNRTRYSRHVYGDAADVFVDEDRNGRIDDLDGDGRSDDDDAELLFAMVESLYGEAWYAPFVGGLGFYPATSARTSFVHTDARGTLARW